MADATTETPGAEAADEFTFESSEDRKYPLCPEGVQKVIVDKAIFEMRDNFQKTAKVSLWLSTADAKYEDATTKEPRSYRLFKTLKVSNHAKANMSDFFPKVCGTGVPMKEVTNADGTKSNRIYIGPRSVIRKEDGEDEVHYKQFEHLEFSVLVSQEKKEDGTMKDKISALVPCSPEQKALNAKLFETL